MSTPSDPLIGGSEAAKKNTGPEDHPEPDLLGRYKCLVCRGFTARQGDDGKWRHLWCAIGWPAWTDQVEANGKKQPL